MSALICLKKEIRTKNKGWPTWALDLARSSVIRKGKRFPNWLNDSYCYCCHHHYYYSGGGFSEMRHELRSGVATYHLMWSKKRMLIRWKRNELSKNKQGNASNDSRCLKITEKVSFKIASEASYVYILNGQKLIKNAKNCPFWRVFDNLKLAVKQCYQTGHF